MKFIALFALFISLAAQSQVKIAPKLGKLKYTSTFTYILDSTGTRVSKDSIVVVFSSVASNKFTATRYQKDVKGKIQIYTIVLDSVKTKIFDWTEDSFAVEYHATVNGDTCKCWWVGIERNTDSSFSAITIGRKIRPNILFFRLKSLP